MGTGWATAPFFDFLQGVSNELARTHIPQVQPRDDANLGPKGRLADMVQHHLHQPSIAASLLSNHSCLSGS